MSIVKYFPFQTMRPNQKEVMEAIERNWESFNFQFIEASTGFGKSAVVYAVAKWLLAEHGKFTHFLASDIYLQNQYLRDFKDIKLIKGRSNYICPVSKFNLRYIYDDNELEQEYPNCADAPCVLDKTYKCSYKPSRVNSKYLEENEGYDEEPFDEYGVKLIWKDALEPHCPYWKAKDEAIHSPLTIHNYHYFMNEMLFSKSFAQRELMVMDEAHTIEGTLMSFIEMNINKRTLDRISNSIGLPYVTIPDHLNIELWKAWLTNLASHIKDRLEIMGTSKQIRSQGADTREIRNRLLAENTLEKMQILVDNIMSTPDNWVWNKTEDGILFRPVRISQFSKDMLFKHSNKHILISATILDSEKLKTYLGITEDVRFLRIHNSNFPVQNRPLFVKSQGKATSATMAEYLPKMMTYIDDVILPKLIKDKGVIHSHTNDIARYILTHSKHKNIMISNVDNFNDKRNDVFQKFFESKPPSIMVTPSMKLGVDLREDLARWQIITKIPYPYLGDPQIKKRTEIDSGWYSYQAVTSLIQTYGRVCRSETDFGSTYVLDGKFDDLFYQNLSILPQWFTGAIRR